MKLVIIESPYRGDEHFNVAYARRCLRDSLRRGEAPLASHLLYTQAGVLFNESPVERHIGIAAGLKWYDVAELCAVYADLGISEGMTRGTARARDKGVPIEERFLFPLKD